jgi:hypothetical protein
MKKAKKSALKLTATGRTYDPKPEFQHLPGTWPARMDAASRVRHIPALANMDYSDIEARLLHSSHG